MPMLLQLLNVEIQVAIVFGSLCTSLFELHFVEAHGFTYEVISPRTARVHHAMAFNNAATMKHYFVFSFLFQFYGEIR